MLYVFRTLFHLRALGAPAAEDYAQMSLFERGGEPVSGMGLAFCYAPMDVEAVVAAQEVGKLYSEQTKGNPSHNQGPPHLHKASAFIEEILLMDKDSMTTSQKATMDQLESFNTLYQEKNQTGRAKKWGSHSEGEVCVDAAQSHDRGNVVQRHCKGKKPKNSSNTDKLIIFLTKIPKNTDLFRNFGVKSSTNSMFKISI